MLTPAVHRHWPDAAERLLLGAALGDGDAALADFARWRNGIDWDGNLDGGSFRLLPLVHANLSRLGCKDPLMGRLGGVYRHSWAEAQGHLRGGGEALGRLRARDIPVMVSKGLLLASHYYASPALRPMSDIDVLVPQVRALEAVETLDAAGWAEDSGARRQWQTRRGDMLALIAGLGVRHPRWGEVDLHWRLLVESGGAATEAVFWRDAEPVVIGGVEVSRPSPSHLLFHVVAHGVRPNVMSPLRWIADAAMILRRDAARIDWDEVLRCGQRLRVGQRLGQGLSYLRDEMRLPVPAGIAANTPPCWVERAEDRAFRGSTAPTRRQPWLDRQAAFARLAVSDARRHLPRLALRWTARRLLPR